MNILITEGAGFNGSNFAPVRFGHTASELESKLERNSAGTFESVRRNIVERCFDNRNEVSKIA
jgi:hypothetical protein